MTDILAFSTWASPLIDAPFWTMIMFRITVLLALAWLAHFAQIRANPRWRVLLWRGAAVGILTLPILSSSIPTFDLPVASSRQSESGFVSSGMVESSPLANLQHGGEAIAAGVARDSSPEPSPPGLWAAYLIIAIWIVGLLLLAVRLIGGYLKIEAVAPAMSRPFLRH